MTLVIVLNVLSFGLKKILKESGYEVSYFWQFGDIPNFIDLIRKTTDPVDKKAYKKMLLFGLLGVCLTIIFFVLGGLLTIDF